MPTHPDPMTPPECDLRGYDYMPLVGQRLFQSRLYAKALRNPRAGLAAVKLWWSAWLESPAGSLPDDDDELATLADFGTDTEGWLAVRELALHGFVKCSDGRLYHPVLCEQAVKAYEYRLKSDAKRETDRDRLRRWRDARKKAVAVPQDEAFVLRTDNADETRFDTPTETRVETRVVAGRSEVKLREEEVRADATHLTPATPSHDPPPSARDLLWREGIPLLRHMTGKPDRMCRPLIGKWLRQLRDDCPGMLRILQDAAATDPADATSWISRSVENNGIRGSPPPIDRYAAWDHITQHLAKEETLDQPCRDPRGSCAECHRAELHGS